MRDIPTTPVRGRAVYLFRKGKQDGPESGKLPHQRLEHQLQVSRELDVGHLARRRQREWLSKWWEGRLRCDQLARTNCCVNIWMYRLMHADFVQCTLRGLGYRMVMYIIACLIKHAYINRFSLQFDRHLKGDGNGTIEVRASVQMVQCYR